uniref:Uncharacterized protein n=1 Tax=Syphacia muris TaxID=451379 RepID=A0A0N5AYN6_9BILA
MSVRNCAQPSSIPSFFFFVYKSGKKSVKDPAAVEFLEKAMYVRTAQSPNENPLNLIQPKNVGSYNSSEILEEEGEKTRSFFMSLGLDNGSVNLRAMSPEEESSTQGTKLREGAKHRFRKLSRD